jgi:hypothetical protein
MWEAHFPAGAVKLSPFLHHIRNCGIHSINQIFKITLELLAPKDDGFGLSFIKSDLVFFNLVSWRDTSSCKKFPIKRAVYDRFFHRQVESALAAVKLYSSSKLARLHCFSKLLKMTSKIAIYCLVLAALIGLGSAAPQRKHKIVIVKS